MIQSLTQPRLQPPAAGTDPFTRIVGQRRAVPFLKTIRDGIRLGTHPHPLLFLGRSGHGKTSLARAFADSIGAAFVRIDCGPELKSEHVVERLGDLKSLAVVFCDEFQSMRKRVQEVLYTAIDSNLVPKLDHGRLDRCADPVGIAPFVLVGATNEPGKLLPALRARMVNVVMDEYSPTDLQAIVRQKSRRFLLSLSAAATDLIVRASGGSPRTIVQILQAVEVTSASWRFGVDDGCGAGLCAGHDAEDPATGSSGSPTGLAALAADMVGDLLAPRPFADEGDDEPNAATGPRPTVPLIPDEFVERALAWMGRDRAGLDATGRTILATIGQHGRATAELLATVLGLDMAFTRENLAELRARQFVQAAPGRGWTLTDTGSRLVTELGLTS
jgi:hypothetical protein